MRLSLQCAADSSSADANMDTEGSKRARRRMIWPKEATALVTEYVNAGKSNRADFKKLLGTLERLTGNPRQACRRFVHKAGVSSTQEYRVWSRADQQRLLDLIAEKPPNEVAKLMRRSTGAVRKMLGRLGVNASMGRDWFTKLTLAQALHIRVQAVEKWIERGWLRTRTIDTGRVRRQIIDADEFSNFCKQHRDEIVGRRLSHDRLEFVRTFVFPPSHADLLPVRQAKKEREAFREHHDLGA